MIKRLACIILCLVFIAGCTPAAPPAAPSPTAAPSSTSTPRPPTAVPTATLPPTKTPQPTATASPTPTATRVVEAISPENAAKLGLARLYGQGEILQVAWSPDAKQLLVLTSVALKAYTPAGAPQWVTETGTVQVQAAYTPDGKSIISHSAAGEIQVYAAATGKPLATSGKAQEGIVATSFSGDGRYLATSNTGSETTVWDVSTGQSVGTNNGLSVPLGIIGTVLSSDGSVLWTNGLGSGRKQQIQSWDVKSGKFLLGLNGINNDYIVQLASSPDGKYLAGISRLLLSSTPDFDFVIWNAATGSLIKRIRFDDDVEFFAFVPGQATAILSLSSGTLVPVDLAKGELGKQFGDQKYSTISMDASTDGKQLAIAGAGGAVMIYDIDASSVTRTISLDLSLAHEPYQLGILSMNYIVRYPRKTGLGVAPDASFVVVPSADAASFDLIDPVNLKKIKSVGSARFAYSVFDLSQDGKLIAAVERNQLSIYDTTSGQVKKQITTDHQYIIQQVAFSPDGKLVATLAGGRFGELFMWDVQSGEKVKKLSGLTTMRFSPDGNFMVSDNLDFGLYLWDVQSGKQLGSPATDDIQGLAYSPDGKVVAIAGAEIYKKSKYQQILVTFLDVATKKMLPMKLDGHPATISVVRYSPDGKLIATGDMQGNVRLWDVQSGQMLVQLNEAAPGPVYLEFTKDGKSLVLGSIDGAIRIYQAGAIRTPANSTAAGSG